MGHHRELNARLLEASNVLAELGDPEEGET